VRVEPRVQRDFGEAFVVSKESSDVSGAYLDKVTAAWGTDTEQEYSPELAAQDRLADELYDFAQIGAATVILVVDEQLRRIHKAIGLVYGKQQLGPLVGGRVHEPPTVPFGMLVQAGANMFRHAHNWEDLYFNRSTGSYEQGKAHKYEFDQAMLSIPTIQKALHRYNEPLTGLSTLQILQALAMNRDSYIPEWLLFRNRLLMTIRDLVYAAGYSEHYRFLCDYVPDVGFPAVLE
jgi:hypothetical protein